MPCGSYPTTSVVKVSTFLVSEPIGTPLVHVTVNTLLVFVTVSTPLVYTLLNVSTFLVPVTTNS